MKKIISGKTILLNTATNHTFLAGEIDEQVQSGTRENDKHIEWAGELSVEQTFGDHLSFVRKEIKNDPDLYNAYKSNIAMAFQDSCHQAGIRFPQLHDISNTAAENFLNLWVKQ